MANVAVVGAQWGDEGKGKVTDLLAEQADLIVRYGGGNNAGHTVRVGDRLYKLHLVPSGILYPGKRCVIGNGTVIDPEALGAELDGLESQGISLEGLRISELAHLIMPYHKLLDRLEEERRTLKIGTTGRGIGPAYGDKFLRYGLRLVDLKHPDRFRELLDDVLGRQNEILTKVYGQEPLDSKAIADETLRHFERLRPFVTDSSLLVHQACAAGERILFEGAQGALLDIEMGTYPYVTSSYPVAGGAAVGSGVGPTVIDHVVGIAKAYTTRVGGGPFPSELHDETGERIRSIGQEFGTTTGRPRRTGWFDAVACRLASRVNSLDSLAITKVDVLDDFDEVKLVVAYRCGDDLLTEFPHDPVALSQCEPVYETMAGWKQSTRAARRLEDLPANARRYLDRLAALVDAPVSLVSVGPGRDETLILEKLLEGPSRRLA